VTPHLNNIKINVTDAEKEHENLQSILNPAAYKILRKIKRRRITKY
jgi:hypothetical protein